MQKGLSIRNWAKILFWINFFSLNQPFIRPADLIPEPEIKPVITLEFRVVEIVVAGCYNVAAPPAFHPSLWINLPARMIKDRINRHNHEKRESGPNMDGNEERHDREQPRRANGLYRVKGKARPGRGLNGAVMTFMCPLK